MWDLLKARAHWLGLFAVMALGLALRLYQIGDESIWFDEAVSIDQSNRPFLEMLAAVAGDNYPPLHNIVLHYWMQLFGTSEAATRFPSALFSCLAILAVYLVGERLFDRTSALFAALLAALSSVQIYYAQEVRFYSLMALLTPLSWYCLICLEERRSLGRGLAYLLATVLLLYTHYFAFFLVLAQNVYVAIRLIWGRRPGGVDWTGLTGWFVLQFGLLICFAPWLDAFLKRAAAVQRSFWLDVPTSDTVIASLTQYAGGSLAFSLSLLVVPLSLFAWIRMQDRVADPDGIAVLERRQWLAHWDTSRQHLLLLLWLIAPILIPFFLSLISQPIYHTRYTIGASAAWFLWIGHGVARVSNNRSLQWLFLALILASAAMGGVRDYFAKQNKDDWRSLVASVEKQAQPQDLVVFFQPQGSVPFHYYMKRSDLNELIVKDIKPDGGLRALTTEADKHRRVWLVLSHFKPQGGEIVKNTLATTHRWVSTEKFLRLELYRTERWR